MTAEEFIDELQGIVKLCPAYVTCRDGLIRMQHNGILTTPLCWVHAQIEGLAEPYPPTMALQAGRELGLHRSTVDDIMTAEDMPQLTTLRKRLLAIVGVV